KLRDHRVRVEVLLRDLTGRSRMPVVVGCDGLGTGDRLLERAESEEPLVGGNRLAESRVLDERRLAGGQIAGRPVAEPARVRLDVDALGNRELGRRTLNVAPKQVWIARDRARVDQAPAVCLERLQIALLRRMDVERELEGLRRTLRQLDDLPELVELQPVHAAGALEATVRSAPRSDCRK